MDKYSSRLLASAGLTAMLVATLAGTARADDATSGAAEHTPMACDRHIPVQDLNGTPKAAKPYKIEISVPSLANPYITGLIYGASIATTDSGVKLSIDSGSGFMDPASQIRQVENAMNKFPDEFVLTPPVRATPRAARLATRFN